MTRQLLEIGIAQRASPGEVRSGDRWFLQQSGKRALLAVIDGLGHGEKAAHAAETALAVLESPMEQSVSVLIQQCHERLQDTRGVAMTLMAFDAAAWRLEWIGVGNVMTVLLHAEPTGKLRRTQLFVRGGVAGMALPSTAAASISIEPGDMVVAATDGLHPAFVDEIKYIESPQKLADRLLTKYRNGHDDTLVVAVLVKEKQ